MSVDLVGRSLARLADQFDGPDTVGKRNRHNRTVSGAIFGATSFGLSPGQLQLGTAAAISRSQPGSSHKLSAFWHGFFGAFWHHRPMNSCPLVAWSGPRHVARGVFRAMSQPPLSGLSDTERARASTGSSSWPLSGGGVPWPGWPATRARPSHGPTLGRRYRREGLTGLARKGRSDRGKHRLSDTLHRPSRAWP